MLVSMNSSHKKYCEEFQTGKVLGRPLKSPHGPQSRCILYCFHFYAKSRALSSVFAISNLAFTFKIQASFSKSRCLLRWICHTKRIIKNFHLERILVGFSNPPTGHEGEEFRVVSVFTQSPVLRRPSLLCWKEYLPQWYMPHFMRVDAFSVEFATEKEL